MSDKKLVYLIGSLRNPNIVALANSIEAALPVRVFDDWQCAGEHADDAWRDHEKARGHTYIEALKRPAAQHVFQFDKKWIDLSVAVVLVCPAGKSGHLEFGYAIGRGKPGFILLDDPERWDVMYQFATGVTHDTDELIQRLREEQGVCYG
jgi:hypothetical protein